MQISGRVFYVTGGCSGLGLAVVDDLVARDGLVCILDRDDQQGYFVEKKYDGCIIFHQCDVRFEEQIVSGLRRALALWPGKLIGGLIHCAGVPSMDKTISSSGEPGSMEIFKAVIDINLTGSFNVARLVAAEIVNQNRPITGATISLSKPTEDQGVIIFTSSTSYQDGQMGQVAYAAGKGGLASMVLPMARDLARFGIRVVAIAPSLFDTQMGKLVSPVVKRNLLESLGFPGRFGDPREFSSLAMECIRNSYLNATVIRLDAGGRMGKI